MGAVAPAGAQGHTLSAAQIPTINSSANNTITVESTDSGIPLDCSRGDLNANPAAALRSRQDSANYDRQSYLNSGQQYRGVVD
jgi:hypothetical protein